MSISLFGRKQHRRRPVQVVDERRATSIPRYYKNEERSKTGPENRKKDAPRRRQTNQHLSRLPTYFAVAIMTGSLAYSSIINNNIHVVIPLNQGLYDASYYQQKASQLMSDSIFNKSKFSFNSTSYRQNLESAIPEIESSKVSIPLVGVSISVGFVFVQPAFIFRVNKIDYIVGDNGVLLAKASDIDDAKLAGLKLIEDAAPLKVSVGSSVLLQSDIAFIKLVISELARASITMHSALLPLGAGEIYIRSEGLPYIIKFSLIGDARQQVGAFLAVKKSIVDSTPNEYIDARLGERVFVK